MFAETKAHSRAIDLELRRMETQEAQQHIQYLLAYMPDSFMSLGGKSILYIYIYYICTFKSKKYKNIPLSD
jgi:dynactin 1